MPKRALAAKNSTSGPMSSTSLRMGSSCFLSGFVSVMRFYQESSPTTARGKIPRGERRKIVDALADADEMHRQAEARGKRHQNAAARAAVELGHHQAGDARGLAENLDLADRVLPDGGVEHQEHRVRRRRLDLAHHAHHLFQFAHQFGRGSAGGRRCRPARCRLPLVFAAVSASKARPAASAPGSRAMMVAPVRSRPDFQLIDGGGAKGVAGDQHHRLALARGIAPRACRWWWSCPSR